MSSSLRLASGNLLARCKPGLRKLQAGAARRYCTPTEAEPQPSAAEERRSRRAAQQAVLKSRLAELTLESPEARERKAQLAKFAMLMNLRQESTMPDPVNFSQCIFAMRIFGDHARVVELYMKTRSLELDLDSLTVTRVFHSAEALPDPAMANKVALTILEDVITDKITCVHLLFDALFIYFAKVGLAEGVVKLWKKACETHLTDTPLTISTLTKEAALLFAQKIGDRELEADIAAVDQRFLIDSRPTWNERLFAAFDHAHAHRWDQLQKMFRQIMDAGEGATLTFTGAKPFFAAAIALRDEAFFQQIVGALKTSKNVTYSDVDLHNIIIMACEAVSHDPKAHIADVTTRADASAQYLTANKAWTTKPAMSAFQFYSRTNNADKIRALWDHWLAWQSPSFPAGRVYRHSMSFFIARQDFVYTEKIVTDMLRQSRFEGTGCKEAEMILRYLNGLEYPYCKPDMIEFAVQGRIPEFLTSCQEMLQKMDKHHVSNHNDYVAQLAFRLSYTLYIHGPIPEWIKLVEFLLNHFSEARWQKMCVRRFLMAFRMLDSIDDVTDSTFESFGIPSAKMLYANRIGDASPEAMQHFKNIWANMVKPALEVMNPETAVQKLRDNYRVFNHDVGSKAVHNLEAQRRLLQEGKPIDDIPAPHQ